MPAIDLESAVGEFQGVAQKSFQAAVVDANQPKPDPATPKELAQWEATTSKGKVQMASALQQLVQADVMLCELRARASYRALVGLIVTANAALESAITNTAGLTVADQTQLIGAHAALLGSLADIVPLALWHEGEAGTTAR